MRFDLSARTRKLLFRLWIVVFTGVMVWAGVTSLHSAIQAKDAVEAVKHNARHDEAAFCVAAWDDNERTRVAIGVAANASAEALISVFPEAPPDRIAGYRASVAAQAEQAQAELADPDCDLEAARAELR